MARSFSKNGVDSCKKRNMWKRGALDIIYCADPIKEEAAWSTESKGIPWEK
jgi:hypothetical protein